MTATEPTTITYSVDASFARKPETEVNYSLWQRLSDAWAGWSDRASLATIDGDAASPWLQRLHWEAANRLEAEHRATVASLAFLDQQIVRLREKIATSHAKLADQTADQTNRTASLAEYAARPISDAPTTAAEETDSRAVVKKRNTQRREIELKPKRDALSRLQGEISALRESLIEDHIELRAATTDRHSHWTVLMVRSAHLLAHYNRRASTYVRAATRNAGGLVRTPDAPQPGWLLDGIVPPVPDQDSTEAGRDTDAWTGPGRH